MIFELYWIFVISANLCICVNVPKMPTSGMRIWSILRIRWVKFLYFFIFSSILRSTIYLKASKSVRRSICHSQSQPSQRYSKTCPNGNSKKKAYWCPDAFRRPMPMMSFCSLCFVLKCIRGMQGNQKVWVKSCPMSIR